MLSYSLFTAIIAFSISTSAHAIPSHRKRDILDVSLPSSDLPAPSTIIPAVSLKFIALSIGTQNYTCISTPQSITDAPIPLGANATLYDASSFLQKHKDLIPTLPSLALGYKFHSGHSICPSLNIPFLGHHFFTTSQTPIFDLTTVSARLVARRLYGVPAPANASPGPNGAGAVDWLELIDNGRNLSFGGLNYVYRVETVGGKAPATCVDEKGSFEVLYAAEYWFYGL